ncbi:unnamed protein product, partial [Ectocarpus fasciculatus]
KPPAVDYDCLYVVRSSKTDASDGASLTPAAAWTSLSVGGGLGRSRGNAPPSPETRRTCISVLFSSVKSRAKERGGVISTRTWQIDFRSTAASAYVFITAVPRGAGCHHR